MYVFIIILLQLLYGIVVLMARIFSLVDAIVSFNQSMYNVDEDEGEIQVVLVLSNPSSADIIVQVVDNSSTALGKLTIFLLTYQKVYRRR